MNKIKYSGKWLYFCTLFLAMYLLPSAGRAQNISGPADVCVGNTEIYVPGLSNPAYIYHWGVNPIPNGAGTVLSGNSAGASILWTGAGNADVTLSVTDPQNGDIEVFHAHLHVHIGALPAPFITSDVLLGCQPLDVDPKREDKNPPKFDSTHCQLVCQNSTVMYHANNGGSGSSYSWSAPGAVAVNPTGADCEVTWGAPGYGQVSVTETSAGGCTGSTSMCVQVVEGPHAVFEPQPNTGVNNMVVCLNGDLVLVDLSTGTASSPIVSRLWIWGDGQTSATSSGGIANTVSHQYTQPGGYLVQLVVTNACGCSDTTEGHVEVMPEPSPVIECPAVVCEGDIINYSIDQPCSANSWAVQGGSIGYQSPSSLQVRWDQVDPETGFGYVMYHACGQCPVVVTADVPVVVQKGVIQGPDIICQGHQYVYRMPKWPATEFDWAVSGPATILPTDQRNEIALTATGSGTITLSVKYTNTVLKCGGSASMSIEVMPPVSIMGDSVVCLNSTHQYSLGSPSGDWVLYDPDNNVAATGSGATFAYGFDASGVYRLSVTGADFCPPEDFFITVEELPEPPDGITGPEGVCVGMPVRYDAGNPQPGTTFRWDVSSGSLNSSVGDHSYITFSSVPATISVRRMTTDAAHCLSDPIEMNIHSAVPALTLSGADPACHSTEEVYTVNYSDADQYEWSVFPPNLGSVVEGGTGSQATILWNIPSGQGQTATITVNVTKCGSTTPVTKNVYVRNTPSITNVTAAPNPVCSGSPVMLKVYTSYPVNSASGVTGEWHDGPGVNGGMPSATGNPPYYAFTHTYNTDGASTEMHFTPAITIHDPNGCAGDLTATGPQITVMPRPVAILSPTGPLYHCGSSGWSETLHATVTTGPAGSNTYTWTQQPAGSPAGSGQNLGPTSVYGAYQVKVTNALNGCGYESNVVSIIEDCDTSNGGGGSGCGGSPTVTLTADPLDCGHIKVNASLSSTPAGFHWILPDHVTATSQTQNTLIAEADAAGNFTIGYEVQGCTHIYHINVPVHYVPEVRSGISCNQSGGNYTVRLDDHSTTYQTTLSSVKYYDASMNLLGSGPFITTPQPGGTTATYYEVITGPNGSCTTSVDVITPDFPSTSIALASTMPPQLQSPYCVNDVVLNFSNTSQGLGLSYLWNFDDNATNASHDNPIGKVYSDANPTSSPYNVTLTVTDEYGCYASDGLKVSIKDNPYANDGHSMTAAPTPTCEGNPVTLTYMPGSGGYPDNFTWYKEDEAIGYSTNPNYPVLESGGYWVSGLGDYGCKVSTSAQIAVVDVHHVPMVTITGKDKQCVDQAFTLSTQDYGPGYTYTWMGAASGNGPSLGQTLSSPGTYTYIVMITDVQTGCSRKSDPFMVTVSSPPAPPSLSFNILNCNPYTVELHASGGGPLFNWSNGMMGPDIQTPYGGPYQVTMTDDNGCRVQNSIEVPKSPAEYLWVFPDGCFCIEAFQGRYVIGPIAWMQPWTWIENGTPIQSGYGLMPDLALQPGNVYNMLLNNGYCEAMSPDMYFNTGNCPVLTDAPRPAPPERPALSAGKGNALLVTPNPATESVSFIYRYAAGSKDRRIEVRDMLGRILYRTRPEGDSGRAELSLSSYASGMYQVVLYRDGEAVAHQKLSVTK